MEEDSEQWIINYCNELTQKGINATYDASTHSVTIVNSYKQYGIEVTETIVLRFYDVDEITSLEQSLGDNAELFNIIKPSAIITLSFALERLFCGSFPLSVLGFIYDTADACLTELKKQRDSEVKEACTAAKEKGVGLVLIEKYYYYYDSRVVNHDIPTLAIQLWSAGREKEYD